jgi:histone deacetylase HOS3
LAPWANQEEFDSIYTSRYRTVFDKARAFLERGRAETLRSGQPYRPLVVVSAGFDASEYEYLSMQRHGVSVPTNFFNRFTRDALAVATEYAGGRMLSLLERGYSDAALATGLFSHLTGMADQPWNSSWVDPDVAKEFERGCKLKWNSATAAARSKMIADSIRMGRAMWPPEVQRQVVEASMAPATTGRRGAGARIGADPIATPSRVLRSTRRTEN